MGSESTSNSIKMMFPPLRLAELMPDLMALNTAESPDTSYSSGEESESSIHPSPRPKSAHATAPQVAPVTPAERPVSRVCGSSHSKYKQNKEKNPFLNDRHNIPREHKDVALKADDASSSCTYPGPGCGDVSCPSLSRHPVSEIKKKNILSIRNNTAVRAVQQASKCTPDYGRHKQHSTTKSTSSSKNSVKSIKTSTPVMKQGIKRFTPGSSGRSTRNSQKKEAVKKSATPNKERARCLFPELQKRPVHPQHSNSQPAVPETPSNHSTPAVTATPSNHNTLSVAATPSNHNTLAVAATPSNHSTQAVAATPSNHSTRAVAATPSYPNTKNSKITLKTFIIMGKSYMFIKKLGSGGSCDVFKVLEVGGECREYAVKCVNMAVERNLAQGYINEIRLLRDLQSSDRVIKLYAHEFDKTGQSLKVVLEVGETDLSSFLKARQATGLPPALILYYWEEMLHAVNHIHQHGVVHADLKPANFLLVCGRLKLIDFGIATSICTDATSVERPCAAGTFSYISPEALMGGAGRYESAHAGYKQDAPIKISFKSDVWSLGCILYSMVYGCTPFGHINSVYAKITAIVNPNHVINYPAAENMPPNLMAAMKWCLTYNAKSRPSVQQLLSIEYLGTSKRHLPQELLSKLEPHVTPDELSLLHKARI